MRKVRVAVEGLLKTFAEVPGCYPEFSSADFPFRMAAVKKGGSWELVEMQACQSQEEEELEEREEYSLPSGVRRVHGHWRHHPWRRSAFLRPEVGKKLRREDEGIEEKKAGGGRRW